MESIQDLLTVPAIQSIPMSPLETMETHFQLDTKTFKFRKQSQIRNKDIEEEIKKFNRLKKEYQMKKILQGHNEQEAKKKYTDKRDKVVEKIEKS